MRVLFLSTWFPYPPDNGSKIRAYYLVRALGRRHQVALVAFRPPDGRADEPALVPAPFDVQVYPVPVDAYRYVRVPQAIKFASPIPVACWPIQAMRKAVAKVAKMDQWDAVVAIQAPAARYALQLSGIPRILDVDTAGSYQARERYMHQNHPVARLRTWVSWQKTHQYETRLLRRFQACTVASPLELDYVTTMVGASNGRVQVVPNGVDCQHHRPGLDQPRPNTLVFNGALTYSLNYDAMRYFLAEIYSLIQQQEPDVSLTITGSTSGVNLAGLQLDESVHLSGYVEDVCPLVAGAWACVVPIQQGGGTRLKILEAMALGTPVVATSKGAEGLAVTHEHDILIADEPAEFAAQVVRLLRDAALRQQLATYARRLVEQRYDWSEIGQRFVDLVEDVVRSHVRRGPIT